MRFNKIISALFVFIVAAFFVLVVLKKSFEWLFIPLLLALIVYFWDSFREEETGLEKPWVVYSEVWADDKIGSRLKLPALSEMDFRKIEVRPNKVGEYFFQVDLGYDNPIVLITDGRKMTKSNSRLLGWVYNNLSKGLMNELSVLSHKKMDLNKLFEELEKHGFDRKRLSQTYTGEAEE